MAQVRFQFLYSLCFTHTLSSFLGSNSFCLKACDPAGRNAARFCEHIYDRIGCAYNAPNNARNGVFESCQGQNQDFPGVYVQNGVTMTYTQPPESLGPITTIPYTARVPASSNCAQFASASIYAAGATASIPNGSLASSATATSASGTTSTTAVTTSTAPSTTTQLSSAPTSSPSTTVVITSTQQTSSSPTGSAPSGSQTGNAAMTLTISGAASFLGVIFSVLFFA